jgi:hypothetical protein
MFFWFPSTRVSNELGAGNPRQARVVVYAALALTFVTAMCISCMLLLIRNVWGQVYSNEEEVIDAVKGLVPLLAVSTAVDSMQAVLSGENLHMYPFLDVELFSGGSHWGQFYMIFVKIEEQKAIARRRMCFSFFAEFHLQYCIAISEVDD